LNLVSNACDAMPAGGVLTIRTENRSVQAGGERDLPPGEYVVLAVADTGVGMDEATRRRAFEPFFTTKAVGEGTGLGLSTVYGIVKQSQGYVFLDSTPGCGTTVEIFLPRVSGVASRPVPDPVSEPAALAGKETILLVEDDDHVRSVTRRVLERSGYAVLEARRADEAMLALELRAGPIHLLLTDLVMPEVGGLELAQQVRERRPEVAVLLMSGYHAEWARLSGPGMHFLAKPFTVAELLGKVREVLDEAVHRR
jgi:CheY-like chemotaxis protein